MKITVLTLFPEIFKPVFSSSIIGRAQKKNLITFDFVDIRKFATDKHKSVDDKPYGGGAGMLMKIDVAVRAISNVTCQMSNVKCNERVVLLDPKGKTFNQNTARRYSKLDHLILVCGHYEGIDSRILNYADEVISIGKYVLTGGEIPAMAVIDSVVRLIPQVLSKITATIDESYGKSNNLEYPQYTRPPVFEGLKVPKVLLSGNHEEIKEWKKKNTKIRK